MKTTVHYSALDAMRGAAAVTIAIFHMRSDTSIPIPSAFLAVDFFFLLSGFVIAHAYDRRLSEGLGFLAFMKLRLVRLYPLIFLGGAIAAAKAASELFLGDGQGDPLSAYQIAAGFVLGTLLLPMPFSGQRMFLNSPAWSLMSEMIANAIYAALFPFMTTRVLGAIIFAGLVGLAFTAGTHGTLHAGVVWPELIEAISRVMFSFFLGVLIYRFKALVTFKRQINPTVALVGLVAALCMPHESAVYHLLFVVALGPVLLILGANSKPVPFSSFMGDMSFTLYAIHRPLLGGAIMVADRIGVPALAAGTAAIAAIIAATPLIGRLYDKPARAWLARAFQSRAPVVSK